MSIIVLSTAHCDRYLFPSEHTSLEWRMLKPHGQRHTVVDNKVALAQCEAAIAKQRELKQKVSEDEVAFVELARQASLTL